MFRLANYAGKQYFKVTLLPCQGCHRCLDVHQKNQRFMIPKSVRSDLALRLLYMIHIFQGLNLSLEVNSFMRHVL